VWHVAFRWMGVGMGVSQISVGVRMGVNNFSCVINRAGRQGTQKPGYVQHSKDNEHDRDRQLHTETDPHRNHETEKNDSGADHEDGESVAEAPESSDQCGPQAVALIGDDGCNRDDVVRVSGVAHPQKEADCEDGEKSDHASPEEYSIDNLCRKRARLRLSLYNNVFVVLF
jgi:hypothetical protein